MKSFFILVSLIASTVFSKPVNTNDGTPLKVAAGGASHFFAFPIGGLLWLNGAISGTRDTNRNSTPEG
jgi:hypothetical protein